MNANEAQRKTLERYGRFMETLSPETLGTLDELCVRDVHFTDPFNDVTGRDRFKHILSCMFEDLDEARFEVLDISLGDGRGYIRWNFTFRAMKRDWFIPGVSEVEMDEDGMIVRHFDHWDSGRFFYARLPVFGWLLRRIQNRLSAA